MADEEGKKKKSPLKWILLLLILAILGGGGWYAYTQFFAGEKTAESAEQEQSADGDEQAMEPADTELVTLPTFLVNLADPLGRRYLKLTMDVEMRSPEAAQSLRDRMSKVRDALILLLSSKTYSELATLESKIILKQEIVEKLNLVLGGANVMKVYFTEMVIQ